MSAPVPLLAVTGVLAAGAALTVAVALPAQAHSGAKLSAVLTGADERPGPGDPDGRGAVQLVVNPGHGTICWTLTVSRIEPATAAHIHVAPRTDPGPVVLPLTAPTDGSSSGCATDHTLARALLRDPGAYYVNVHNTPFPGGAVRGQLSK